MNDSNLAFVQAISTRADEIDIARAALSYARDAYPDLDISSYLGLLDRMADVVRPRLDDCHPLDALNVFLFDELGFYGNVENYFDPRNSFLNQVLDRRTGIPITLSVVYLELAWRLGLSMAGVGLPGHFIVRYDGDTEPIYLDPFYGGAVMSVNDCRLRVADISGGHLPFHISYLDPVGSRDILSRMLQNLKGIYTARTDFVAAISIVEKLILLNPSDARQVRDLGLLHYYAGHKLKAIGCLGRYLSHFSDAEDAQIVQHNLRAILEQVARWN